MLPGLSVKESQGGLCLPGASAMQLVPTEHPQELDMVSLRMFLTDHGALGSDVPLQASIYQMGTLIVLLLRKWGD